MNSGLTINNKMFFVYKRRLHRGAYINQVKLLLLHKIRFKNKKSP